MPTPTYGRWRVFACLNWCVDPPADPNPVGYGKPYRSVSVSGDHVQTFEVDNFGVAGVTLPEFVNSELDKKNAYKQLTFILSQQTFVAVCSRWPGGLERYF